MKIVMLKINILAPKSGRPRGCLWLLSDLGIRQTFVQLDRRQCRMTENLFEFVKAHIDGITAGIKGSMKGDGHSTGKC
jgi:hypothetical protein